jgi:putative ABC transport system permease protein
MRVPLKQGRLFSEGDRDGALPVTIVNEVMAERYWPDGDALDRRLTVSWQGRPRTVQIVGVVGALRHDGLDAAPRPEIFLPFDQMPFGSMTFVVRATGDAAALVPSVKARIWEVDPTLPFYDVATLDGLVAESLTPRRVMMQLLGALAGLAFVLAAAGLYGLLSFSTAQRTREIGVRMAMGARTRDILRLVVGEGLVLVGVGVLVALAGALAVTRVLAASLFQVSPTDPATFLLATALRVE